MALSVLGGCLIPFLYGVTVGPLTPYIQHDMLNELAGYPVRWPIIVLHRVLPLGSFPFRDADTIFLLLYIVVCDLFLYSVVTYFFLGRFLKRETQQLRVPPEPPSFVQR